MLTIALFILVRRGQAPHILHLLSTIFSPHQIVIECVFFFALSCLGCPQNEFGGMRETSTTEIWWGCWFLPYYVVEDSETQFLHRKANRWIDVNGAGNPDGARWL